MRKIIILMIAAAWVACFSGGAAQNDSLSPSFLIADDEPIFPHKSLWADPEEHGIYVKAAFHFDTRYCASCHGKNLQGESGPSCHSCHSVYPHTEHGITKATHGAYVRASGTKACATKCHGTTLKGGMSGVSCTDCHASYPHPDNWANVEQHGLQAIGSLKNNCVMCHGENLNGGSSGVSCQSCHAQYPHTKDWVVGTQHGAEVSKNGTSACATNCHGTALQGGPANVNIAEKQVNGCGDCHMTMPHAPLGQWDHGRSKLTADGRLDTGACTVCHGSDLQGSDTTPSCYSCHTTYPAQHRTNTWEKSGHGAAGKNNTAACAICHGSDLQGGVAKKSCYSCHAQYPHIATWKADHGKLMQDHAAAAQQTRRQYIQLNCTASCHNITSDKLGPACVTCHDPQNQYPHPTDWYVTGDPYGGSHGPAVVAAAMLGAGQAAQAAGCLTACHGTAGSTGFLPDSNRCTTCHSFYPHPNDWTSTGNGYSAHGLAVINTQDTASKDDDTMDVTNSQKYGACAKCHSGPIPLRPYSWFNDANLPKLLDLPNGAKVPRCYACHYYPHETYWFNWKDDNPWNYFHNSAFSDWYYLEHFDLKSFAGTKLEYAQKNCGGTYNSMGGTPTSGGCHTDGPHFKGWGWEGCDLCHK